MSVKSKVFATAAALAVIGGAAVAGTLPANAETPECGQSCVELFPSSNPQLILDDQSASEATGAPITTSSPSVTNEGEDFVITGQGLVSSFFQAGQVSAGVALHYGCEAGVDFATCIPGVQFNYLAFELQFAPYGAPTGECVGIPSTAVDGTEVSLQPCGVGPRTIWIVDSSQSIGSSFVPLISATDTNFSTPFVLTFTSAGAVLQTATLESPDGQVSDDQLWSEHTGPLVAPLAVATTSLPAATGGQPYSASLTATGGVPPYSWSVTSGSLPPGLTLNSSTGQISGTPDVAGTYSFTVTVTDSESPAMRATSQTLSISVSGPVITALEPDSGPVYGDMAMGITGTGLSCPPGQAGCRVSVTFGGKPALAVLVVGADELFVVDPPGRGTVTVTVTVGGVSSQATAVTEFTYTGFL